MLAFRRKSPLRLLRSSQMTSRPTIKKDVKQTADRYHADRSLSTITAAPSGEILTQKKSTVEAAALCFLPA